MSNDKTDYDNLASFAYPQVGSSDKSGNNGTDSQNTKPSSDGNGGKSKNSDSNSGNDPGQKEPFIQSTDSKPSAENDLEKDKNKTDNDKDAQNISNDKEQINSEEDKTTSNSPSKSDENKTEKPTDLEAQLNSLSGLGTPLPPEKRENLDEKPNDLSQQSKSSSKNDEAKPENDKPAAPPTLGKGEINTKNSEDSPLKKIANKLSKVKDELVDPSVSMGNDGINLSGNNPIETPNVPPSIGPGQDPPSLKEIEKMKEKEADKQEVAVMKDQLKNLRENEEKTDNISINSNKSMDDPNRSGESPKIQTTQSDDQQGVDQKSSSTIPSTTSSTTIAPSQITPASSPPPLQTPPVSSPPSFQTPPPITPVAPNTVTQPAKADPMGLNQPMQPILQKDPDVDDSGAKQMESPLKSDQSKAESIMFQDLAAKEISSSQGAPESAQSSSTPPAIQPTPQPSPSTLSPTPSPTSQKPTLPSDPVIPNPTITKVTEDLAPEVDEKHKSTPMATLKKPDTKDAPTVKHSRYPYTIEQLLDIVVERDASDLHITVGYPAMIRVDGSLVNVLEEPVHEAQAPDLILPVLPEQKKELLDVNREVDLAYPHREDARFRINAYYQQQTLAAAFRLIPNRIRSIDELNLPQVYHKLSKLKQGLVLVTGPTGSGKSTTLAAIIQEINDNRPDHIITIEDPVEYVFPKAMGMVDQRELHEDTHSWEIALRSAMRQDPDVILVGEMRDFDTISAAITLAETGHLVFATLHTNSAAQTLDRIVDVFPEHQQAQVRSQLSLNIEAVVAQRLIPLQRGGRTAVSEIMIATPAIRNLIREAKTHQIDNVIRTSADIGMISLEHTLVRLVRENVITMERAQEYAVHPEEIVRLLKS